MISDSINVDVSSHPRRNEGGPFQVFTMWGRRKEMRVGKIASWWGS